MNTIGWFGDPLFRLYHLIEPTISWNHCPLNQQYRFVSRDRCLNLFLTHVGPEERASNERQQQIRATYLRLDFFAPAGSAWYRTLVTPRRKSPFQDELLVVADELDILS